MNLLALTNLTVIGLAPGSPAGWRRIGFRSDVTDGAVRPVPSSLRPSVDDLPIVEN